MATSTRDLAIVPPESHGPTDARVEMLEGAGGAGPSHRRRQGWYELNPGCFGRAVLAILGACAAAVAGAGCVGAWTAWRTWRTLRRTPAVRAARLGVRTWRLYRRVRGRTRRA